MTDNSPKLRDYLILMRLDKPIGIWLLMWPMLWSMWIASEGKVEIKLLVVFLIGVVVMRSAGCVLNDIADRDFDPFVKRTSNRPIASGKIAVKNGIYLFMFLMGIAASLLYALNDATKILAIIGAIITIIYPFLKRILSAPQLFLGVAFGWAIPMSFSANLGYVPIRGWLIFLIAIFWAVVYDTYYAMVDRDDDINLPVKSTAILFGKYDLFFVGIFQCMMVAALFIMASIANLGLWVYISIFLSMGLMIYHQYLTNKRDREACFRAFMHNHYIGMIIFIGIILHYHFPI